MRAIGLGRFAPDIPKSPYVNRGLQPVAEVNGTAAISEIDAMASIREQFARYLAHSNGSTAAVITHAAVQLISFAVGQACGERKCAEEQIQAVCEGLRKALLAKYDAETGQRRSIVEAKVLF